MSTGKFYKKKSDFMSRYIGDESASGIGQNDDSSASEDNNPLGNVEANVFLDDDDDLTFEPPPSKIQRKVGNKLSRSNTGRKPKGKNPQKKPINQKSSEESQQTETPVPSPPETSRSGFDEGNDVNNEEEDAVDLSNSNKKKRNL